MRVLFAPLFAAFLMLPAFLLAPTDSILFTVAAAQSADAATTISWAELLNPWMPSIMAAVAALIIAFVTLLTSLFKKWTGIAIEDSNRAAIQASLTNAAGKAIMILADQIKDARLNAQHPAIKQAVEYVNQSAAGAVKAFDLKPEQIAEKIIAKIGILTAPDPTSAPKDITPPPPDPGAGS
jgi:hypothetical protein